MQLRLKEVVGRALLDTDMETHKAALVIPVKVPPRIYRLKSRLDELFHWDLHVGTSNWARQSRRPSPNYYTIKDSQDWLRTVDFTPEKVFGRSFAYRLVFLLFAVSGQVIK